jgi:hypothetical protein
MSDLSTSPFSTFWQAGYEGSDHINRAQKTLSMNQSTGHLGKAFEDYSMLKQFGIKTIRESIGWRLAEANNGFDFSFVEPRKNWAFRFAGLFVTTVGLKMLTCIHRNLLRVSHVFVVQQRNF